MNFRRVAVIGAGSRGEFREEDQMCCAWIAESLIERGYLPEDRRTIEIVERWSKAPADAWIGGKSATYLTASGQDKDLSFILENVDDLISPFMMQNEEVIMSAELKGQVRDGFERGAQIVWGHVDAGRPARLL